MTLPWVIAGGGVGLLVGARPSGPSCSPAAPAPGNRRAVKCPDCSAPIPRKTAGCGGQCCQPPAAALHASARIGPYPLAAELAAAIALALVAARASSGPGLAALAWLTLVAVPLALTDIAVHRLPRPADRRRLRRHTRPADPSPRSPGTSPADLPEPPSAPPRSPCPPPRPVPAQVRASMDKGRRQTCSQHRPRARLDQLAGIAYRHVHRVCPGRHLWGRSFIAMHRASRTSQLPLAPFILLGALAAIALLPQLKFADPLEPARRSTALQGTRRPGARCQVMRSG